VFPPKNLDFPASRTHPLDELVHFVRLSARLSDFRNHNVSVDAPVYPRRELEVALFIVNGLDSNEHVLFGVIEPVSRPSQYVSVVGAVINMVKLSREWVLGYGGLYLVDLHPNQFVHPSVPPHTHTLPSNLHGSTGDPEEEQTFVLK
jgi:hypothetical protein